jgi:hypothetical protein
VEGGSGSGWELVAARKDLPGRVYGQYTLHGYEAFLWAIVDRRVSLVDEFDHRHS